jgi:hypothetical protein
VADVVKAARKQSFPNGNADTLHCASPLFENRWRQIQYALGNADKGKLRNPAVGSAGSSWQEQGAVEALDVGGGL